MRRVKWWVRRDLSRRSLSDGLGGGSFQPQSLSGTAATARATGTRDIERDEDQQVRNQLP